MTAAPAFTCPKCGATSHHPEDVRHGYCGRCHAFTRDEAERIVRLVRRPALERLVEGWEALSADLDPWLAAVEPAERVRILGHVMAVGVAVEELRLPDGPSPLARDELAQLLGELHDAPAPDCWPNTVPWADEVLRWLAARGVRP